MLIETPWSEVEEFQGQLYRRWYNLLPSRHCEHRHLVQSLRWFWHTPYRLGSQEQAPLPATCCQNAFWGPLWSQQCVPLLHLQGRLYPHLSEQRSQSPKLLQPWLCFQAAKHELLDFKSSQRWIITTLNLFLPCKNRHSTMICFQKSHNVFQSLEMRAIPPMSKDSSLFSSVQTVAIHS